ncbi:MAG: TIGR00730 family Rossman fold protein [Gammaproteobacteria bacterium]|nr:TIGR00730 family Rossman fold protein [Gammaproteobacteria bacterium]
MRSVCVYLGASEGSAPAFLESVVLLGQTIAALNLRLVYGGSSMGLMGLLANTVKDAEGTAVGIITKHLVPKEKPLERLDALHLVDSMQMRKKMMQDESDMFLVMPGGLGTVEEAIDTWNAIRIGELHKPIGFFNQNGYFDLLFEFMASCEVTGFLSEAHRRIPLIDSDVKSLLLALTRVVGG